MTILPHPAFEKFRQRIDEHRELLRPWSGFCYRVTTLDYPTSRAILSGEGSFRNGGRWNAVGSFRAVYGSTEDVIAVRESRAAADYFGVAYPFVKPRLLVAIELKLQSVLDLTTPKTQAALEWDASLFLAEDWRKLQEKGQESFSQMIGRAAFEAGAEGLLVSSARIKEGVNVVLFPANLRAGSAARVCEGEKLDRLENL